MSTAEIRGWLAGRLPEGLWEAVADVIVDREEITVIGRIAAPEISDEADDAERDAAIEGRIAEFRERTRGTRIAVARETERRFDRRSPGAWSAPASGRCSPTSRPP